jgi:hypothetical protein
MEQGAMRNAIVSFFLGFVLAQAAWWFAAGGTFSGGGSGPSSTLPFVLLDLVEILVASACFALAVALAGRARKLRRSGGALLLSLVAGATTSTIAAPPSALVPRLLSGDGQFVIDIIAAALVSAAFGWLVASAFGSPVSPAEPSPSR